MERPDAEMQDGSIIDTLGVDQAGWDSIKRIFDKFSSELNTLPVEHRAICLYMVTSLQDCAKDSKKTTLYGITVKILLPVVRQMAVRIRECEDMEDKKKMLQGTLDVALKNTKGMSEGKSRAMEGTVNYANTLYIDLDLGGIDLAALETTSLEFMEVQRELYRLTEDIFGVGWQGSEDESSQLLKHAYSWFAAKARSFRLMAVESQTKLRGY